MSDSKTNYNKIKKLTDPGNGENWNWNINVASCVNDGNNYGHVLDYFMIDDEKSLEAVIIEYVKEMLRRCTPEEKLSDFKKYNIPLFDTGRKDIAGNPVIYFSYRDIFEAIEKGGFRGSRVPRHNPGSGIGTEYVTLEKAKEIDAEYERLRNKFEDEQRKADRIRKEKDKDNPLYEPFGGKDFGRMNERMNNKDRLAELAQGKPK